MNAGGTPWVIAERSPGPDPVEMLDELDTRLEEARSGERPIDVQELERLYTSGCAKVLELEADSLRITRRVSELREQLRHVRTAIDWLHEQQAAAEPSQ